MKKVYPCFIILLLSLASTAFAQNYSTSGLPDGAKMRLGKVEIHGLQFSPDGNDKIQSPWQLGWASRSTVYPPVKNSTSSSDIRVVSTLCAIHQMARPSPAEVVLF